MESSRRRSTLVRFELNLQERILGDHFLLINPTPPALLCPIICPEPCFHLSRPRWAPPFDVFGIRKGCRVMFFISSGENGQEVNPSTTYSCSCISRGRVYSSKAVWRNLRSLAVPLFPPYDPQPEAGPKSAKGIAPIAFLTFLIVM